MLKCIVNVKLSVDRLVLRGLRTTLYNIRLELMIVSNEDCTVGGECV